MGITQASLQPPQRSSARVQRPAPPASQLPRRTSPLSSCRNTLSAAAGLARVRARRRDATTPVSYDAGVGQVAAHTRPLPASSADSRRSLAPVLQSAATADGRRSGCSEAFSRHTCLHCYSFLRTLCKLARNVSQFGGGGGRQRAQHRRCSNAGWHDEAQAVQQASCIIGQHCRASRSPQGLWRDGRIPAGRAQQAGAAVRDRQARLGVYQPAGGPRGPVAAA